MTAYVSATLNVWNQLNKGRLHNRTPVKQCVWNAAFRHRYRLCWLTLFHVRITQQHYSPRKKIEIPTTETKGSSRKTKSNTIKKNCEIYAFSMKNILINWTNFCSPYFSSLIIVIKKTKSISSKNILINFIYFYGQLTPDQKFDFAKIVFTKQNLMAPKIVPLYCL